MKKFCNILFLSFGILFFGCSKKYPEDGFHYVFKSPEKRIVGTWQLTNYYINGINATNFLYNQYIGWGQYGFNAGPIMYQYGIIDFNIGDADPNGNHVITAQSIDGGGSLVFKNDNNYLQIGFGMEYGNVQSNPLLYNPFRSIQYVNSPFWKINELTNITFKISGTYRDTSYQIEFAKQYAY